MNEYWFLPLVGFFVATYFAVKLLRRARRRKLLEAPIDPEFEGILQANVPLYAKLPGKLRPLLKRRINVFLDDKHFEGCAGFEIDKTARVTIAAYACLLTLKRSPGLYSSLSTILVYPNAYKAPKEELLASTTQTVEGKEFRLGESWNHGTVVLSWSSICDTGTSSSLSENTAIHEFAHQLDQEDGSIDGTPAMNSREDYKRWAEIMSREFENLQTALAENRLSTLRAYGATSPAEFFAVAAESFFENAVQLRKAARDLYSELQSYFQLDPAEW